MNTFEYIPIIYNNLIVFVLINTRISTLLLSVNIFRKNLITTRLLISLSVVLSYIVLLSQPHVNLTIDLFSVKMLFNILREACIGFFFAITINILFEIFIAVGQVISLQIGLGMASLIDQRYGYITNLTEFYLITSVIIFLSINGHLYLISLIMKSFDILQLTTPINIIEISRNILEYAGSIFADAVLLSMTIILVLLLTNISLAVMTKFAPQFNIFSIGINMQLIIGLLCVYLTFFYLTDNGVQLIKNTFGIISQYLTMESNYVR